MKAITAGILAAAMAAGMAFGAYAAVTEEDAIKTALDAVGLKEEDVIFKPVESDRDDGRNIYDVDFFVPGEVKYEFDIDSDTGAIVEQDIDLWEADDDLEFAPLIKAAKEAAAEGSEEETDALVGKIDGEITELQAKMIALKDAGYKADEVKFTRCEADMDDGVRLYEVEIRLADGTEYDYDIRISDGKILEKNVDVDD